MHAYRQSLAKVAIVATLVFLFVGAVPTVHAQNGRIVGTVSDANTGESLPGANVVIQGTSKGAATDIEGAFAIPSVAAGTHTLIFSYVGYDRLEREVTVEAGETVTVDAELAWAGVEGEEVVITAQAEGQVGAINQQLSSNTIANVVSEARIKELPDVNAAESIGRLPGVSIQRSGGEATKVSIRGLSPKYNNVTVNGVKMPATGASDRSVDLSLVSSNALDGIEVKKAITPDMDADAIGGSVDLKLKNAPEGFQGDFTAQGGYNELQDYYGNYKFAASVSNRFFESRLGVIASFNLDEYDRSADKLDASYRFVQDAQTDEDMILVSNLYLRDENVQRGRLGGSVVMDYQIPAGRITANSFYQQSDYEGLYRIRNTDVGGNPRQYWSMEDRGGETAVFTGALGIEQDFDFFRYDASFARTFSQTDNPEDFTWTFSDEGGILDSLVTPEMRPRDVPYIVTNDSLTGLADINEWSVDREENVTTAQLNLQMPFQFGNDITGYVKTGGKLRWLDRMNDQQQFGRGGLQYGSGVGNLNEPLECVQENLPSGWDLVEMVGTQGVVPIGLLLDRDFDTNAFLDDDDAYDLFFSMNEDSLMTLARAMQGCPEHHREQAIGSRGQDYEGEERYQAGYVMAEIRLGNRITLMPGIRYEADQSEYTGQRYREVVQAWQAQEPVDLDTLVIDRSNEFWLPMVHLTVEPTDWLKLRLARTETLTRPDYLQYAPITTIDAFRSTISAANSTLRPAESVNYDASLSVYQNKVGLFTVSAFTKKIDDVVVPASYQVVEGVPFIEGTNVPENWRDGAPRLYTNINNPNPAYVRGIEFDLQTNFWYLPNALKGLVLSANYTYIQSETTYEGFEVATTDSLCSVRPPTFCKELVNVQRQGRIPDQPSHIANVMLGYDYKGFSTRLSFLYQTDRTNFVDSTRPLFDTFSDDYFRVDLSASQRLATGLELFANLNNLNGERDRNSRAAEDDYPTYIEHYGFTVDVGARYRF